MIPSAFDYARPASLEEALSLLGGAGDRQVKVLAGGQSLIPVLRMRLSSPDLLVDLGGIPGLAGVSEEGDHVVIGAMTTHSEVMSNPLVATHAAVLAKAAATVADPQVRHLGTLGGALAHADPAGDLGAPVLALDASMVIAGPTGQRTVTAKDFFTDVFTTAVGEGELLTQIRIPKHTGWSSHYEKLNGVAQAWSIVAVAAAIKADGGTISQAKVGLTNMGLVPLRATAVEAALVGQPATAQAVAAAAARAVEGTAAMEDANAGVDYRNALVQVLTRRAVLAAVGS